MQLCRSPVLIRWENERMLSSAVSAFYLFSLFVMSDIYVWLMTAAIIGGAVLILLLIILILMFIVYRMRKKDEGSYSLDEPRHSFSYTRAKDQEFFAWIHMCAWLWLCNGHRRSWLLNISGNCFAVLSLKLFATLPALTYKRIARDAVTDVDISFHLISTLYIALVLVYYLEVEVRVKEVVSEYFRIPVIMFLVQ